MKAEPGRLRFPFGATLAFGALAFLYLPIIVLVVLSFNASDITTIWTGFSTRWYDSALNNSDMLRALLNSLIVATSATILAVMMAIPAFNRRGPAESLVGLPLLVPEIVTAVALLVLFVSTGFRLGLVTIILAHTVFCIPFAYYPIRSRLVGLDPALLEAGSDLYATSWRRFWRIEMPLLAPGMLAGALLSFISSLGDFVVTYFVSGPGSTTLPVYIYGLIRVGVTPEVNALSALLLAATLPVIALAFVLRSPTVQPNNGANTP